MSITIPVIVINYMCIKNKANNLYLIYVFDLYT